VSEWIEEYRRFWDRSLDRLSDYLKVIQQKQEPASKKRRKTKKGSLP
jgi:hypothetical protein